MRFISSLALLLRLVSARPIANSRQAVKPAKIVSVSPFGPGCPPGTFALVVSPDGQEVTVGFDSYSTSVNPDAASQDREKFCDITVAMTFPRACTTVGLATTYHGFAEVESGVTGSLASAYTLSPGVLTGSNPPTTTFSSTDFGNGNVYTKQDALLGTVLVRNTNEQNASFIARSRLFLIAANSTVSGLVTVDDTTIAITQQSKC